MVSNHLTQKQKLINYISTSWSYKNVKLNIADDKIIVSKLLYMDRVIQSKDFERVGRGSKQIHYVNHNF